MKTKETIWTEQEQSVVREYWGVVSASEIARMLTNKSRNAVIGKAHRMGLGAAYKTPRADKPRKRDRKPPKAANENKTVTKKVRPPPMKPPREAPLPLGRHPIGIMQLNRKTCRAIVGRDHNGLATYCGEEVFPGHVWCAGHCVLYYRPGHERRAS